MKSVLLLTTMLSLGVCSVAHAQYGGPPASIPTVAPNTASNSVIATQRPDGTQLAADGTDASSVTPPTGGVGIRGWLSGIYQRLGGTLSISDTATAALSTLASGLGLNTVPKPTSAAANAIAPVASTALEGSHVLKASAGNLYGFSITTGASAGFVIVLDSATVPADGTITGVKKCYVIQANSTLSASFASMPDTFTNGIVVLFSTAANCFTKTASATAFISGDVQ